MRVGFFLSRTSGRYDVGRAAHVLFQLFPAINNAEPHCPFFSERNCCRGISLQDGRFSQINMPDHDTDLRRATELVAEAQRFVYEQKGKIIRLKSAGVDTSDAERTLQMFKTNLKMFEEHRDTLQSSRQ
jgi:hypothetical protein